MRPVAPRAPPHPSTQGNGPQGDGLLSIHTPSLRMCGFGFPPSQGWLPSSWTNMACVPRVPVVPINTPSFGQELISVFWGLVGSPWWPRGQHLGGSIVFLFENIVFLGPGTPSTFKAPHPSPHPVAFISMQAQAALTQGDCSLCMLRVGGWEQAAHTPWQAQAAEKLACPTLCPQTGSVHPPTLLQPPSPMLSS